MSLRTKSPIDFTHRGIQARFIYHNLNGRIKMKSSSLGFDMADWGINTTHVNSQLDFNSTPEDRFWPPSSRTHLPPGFCDTVGFCLRLYRYFTIYIYVYILKSIHPDTFHKISHVTGPTWGKWLPNWLVKFFSRHLKRKINNTARLYGNYISRIAQTLLTWHLWSIKHVCPSLIHTCMKHRWRGNLLRGPIYSVQLPHPLKQSASSL